MAKQGSEKYEKEGIQEINTQLEAAMTAFGSRLARAANGSAEVGHRFIDEAKHWWEWPNILTHNFTNAFNNLMPLRKPMIELMFVLTVLLCLLIIRWAWVAFLECLEGLHVYCFPEPNIVYPPPCAPPIVDACCDDLPCKPTLCDSAPCSMPDPPICQIECTDEIETVPCPVSCPPPCQLDCTNDHCDGIVPCTIDDLEYVEDLPRRPIEIGIEPTAVESVRTEERVVASQPEEIIQSSSLRSSARSMRTIGFEHSIKMRNAQRTEHIERTVVSN